jgi:uncharacterized protein YcbK (DUF882 family)
MRRILYIVPVFITLLVFVACTSSSGAETGKANIDLEGTEHRYPAYDDEPLSEILKQDTSANPYERRLEEAPNTNCKRIRIHSVGNLAKVFNDSNHVQLVAAKALGIVPIENLQSAWNVTRPLAKVESCREYYLEELTHSYPYLVPEAASLLREIGARFIDSLNARGGGNYRIKVTSVLRTPETVRRLQRVNGNATKESTHQYGTSFDISFKEFICDSVGNNRTFEDLKNLLAEVLRDLQLHNRCYVKFERHQSCFHITARPDSTIHN